MDDYDINDMADMYAEEIYELKNTIDDLVKAAKLYQAAIASCLSVGGVLITDDGIPNPWWEAMIAAQQVGAKAIKDATAP